MAQWWRSRFLYLHIAVAVQEEQQEAALSPGGGAHRTGQYDVLSALKTMSIVYYEALLILYSVAKLIFHSII